MHPEKEFFEHIAGGRFMLLRSASTGRHVFYPRAAVPGSGEQDLQWVPASGLGTVYSTTVVRQRAQGTDYNLAIVELDEGPRMMSRVDRLKPEHVEIGMRVRARIEPATEQRPAILIFAPDEPEVRA